MMLTANKNAYKYIVLLVGLIVLTGNFFPELPIWGFDYYIIGEPFNFKFFPGFVIILIISTYPFFNGKNKHYDGLYALIAILAFSFIFIKWVTALGYILNGYNSYIIYKETTGEEYLGNSLFFSFTNQGIILLIFYSYLLWSLRLAAFSWKEIIITSWSVVVSVIIIVSTWN